MFPSLPLFHLFISSSPYLSRCVHNTPTPAPPHPFLSPSPLSFSLPIPLPFSMSPSHLFHLCLSLAISLTMCPCHPPLHHLPPLPHSLPFSTSPSLLFQPSLSLPYLSRCVHATLPYLSLSLCIHLYPLFPLYNSSSPYLPRCPHLSLSLSFLLPHPVWSTQSHYHWLHTRCWLIVC